MTRIEYYHEIKDYLYKNNSGTDFMSPASQDVIRRWGAPHWETEFASRAYIPSWERPDIFRKIMTRDVSRVIFIDPEVISPAQVVNPSGMVNFKMTSSPSSISLPDNVLYHHNVQKVFSVLLHFDTMLEHQVAAFAGIDLDEARRCLRVLHSARVIQRTSERSWKYNHEYGPIWRMNLRSVKVAAYYDGMDALSRMLLAGGGEKLEYNIPPGAGARLSIKHNLHTAEIMLRIAEASDNIIGVWGDYFAAESLFHDYMVGAKKRDSHGDAIAVTKDGSIIIFEVVGAVSSKRGAINSVINKAASWVGVIASSELDISVVFVDTTWHQDRKKIVNAIDVGVRKESKAYAPDEFRRQKALSHIGIVNAAWWFPDDTGSHSESMTRIGGYCPATYSYKAFDEPDPFFSDSETRKNLVINSVSALHTPPWMTDSIKERVFR